MDEGADDSQGSDIPSELGLQPSPLMSRRLSSEAVLASHIYGGAMEGDAHFQDEEGDTYRPFHVVSIGRQSEGSDATTTLSRNELEEEIREYLHSSMREAV
jgi:hypothetical protein